MIPGAPGHKAFCPDNKVAILFLMRSTQGLTHYTHRGICSTSQKYKTYSNCSPGEELNKTGPSLPILRADVSMYSGVRVRDTGATAEDPFPTKTMERALTLR